MNRSAARLIVVLVMFVSVAVVAPSAHATFPGKNGKIAFSSDRDAGKFEVWTTNPDGSDPNELTTDPSALAEPAWSPDGRKVAFAACRGRAPESAYCNTDIYVMNADGSGQTRLTHDPAYDANPAWSPDGQTII